MLNKLERFKPKEALGEEKKERVSEGERERREVWKDQLEEQERLDKEMAM